MDSLDIASSSNDYSYRRSSRSGSTLGSIPAPIYIQKKYHNFNIELTIIFEAAPLPFHRHPVSDNPASGTTVAHLTGIMKRMPKR